ncbi:MULTISPECIES: ASCH domain-containing protein [Comamonas]|uniref:ASCH domain-containing protein n=1 Tax=Comamonas squillarum TaxID=2977320 RepID=A0ABY6A0P9_9BURK|nr:MULTISPECIES: hypothetical protein [Comamonas]UXC19119.1 hypothetical protein N4T19_03055 [Comamonas sp. PR12]
MKETGLMFKAPLVRAILSGQKTQTRRIAKDVRHPDLGNWYTPGALALEGEPPHVIHRACPLGQPGDRIYVRETFLQGYDYDPVADRLKQYDEDGNELPKKTWFRATDNHISWTDEDGWETNTPWKPAIHMPKALARIWLEITGVRVERLQAISEEDAEAEGVGFLRSVPDADETLTAKQLFECLWDSTGGDWAANPWVWVIDFKRIDQPAPKEAP